MVRYAEFSCLLADFAYLSFVYVCACVHLCTRYYAIDSILQSYPKAGASLGRMDSLIPTVSTRQLDTSRLRSLESMLLVRWFA